jgi:ABC-type dipeptide/oligopeptide/nickel transport system permease component
VRAYIARRVLILIPTFLGVTLITFLIVRLIPGDPVTVILGEHATGEQYERLRRLLGLDQPVLTQYFRYLGRLFTGDWGTSVFGAQDVLALVIRRFRSTLLLVSMSTAISALIGITLGVVSGLRANSLFDKGTRLVTLFAFSIPTFWLALVLVLTFAVGLGWFPSLGGGSPSGYVLPIVTLSAWQLGLITRTTRMSVLETLSKDFVVTARAKGIGVRRITLRHVLPNSLIPVITIIGLQFGGLLGGAVVTEVVFAYPGLGRLIVDNIFARDYPVVQGAIAATALAFMVVNLITDLLYAYLDPRIRVRGG